MTYSPQILDYTQLPAQGSPDERRRATLAVAIYADRAGAGSAETRDLLDMLGLLDDEPTRGAARTAVRAHLAARGKR